VCVGDYLDRANATRSQPPPGGLFLRAWTFFAGLGVLVPRLLLRRHPALRPPAAARSRDARGLPEPAAPLADYRERLTPRARGMEQIDKNGWSAVERIANVL
jgi:hypothetical protein